MRKIPNRVPQGWLPVLNFISEHEFSHPRVAVLFDIWIKRKKPLLFRCRIQERLGPIQA